MALIGIACNPQSGKDIRRLLTTATTIDDAEKLNIIERILLSAAAVARQRVCIMPDRLGYGRLLLQKSRGKGYPGDLSQLELFEMEITETQSDTTFFAAQMEVAGEVGISQAQVSRLEKSALNSIKRSICVS